MAEKPLYFQKTTKTELEFLHDVLNRKLQKDDFVTAVFRDGELTLFQIVGFENHKIEYFIDYAQLNHHQNKGIVLNNVDENAYVILKRVTGTNAYSLRNDIDAKKLNAKLVYKTSKQIAYADPEYVLMHLFVS